MTSITAASKAIDWEFAYVCVCVLESTPFQWRRKAASPARDSRQEGCNKPFVLSGSGFASTSSGKPWTFKARLEG